MKIFARTRQRARAAAMLALACVMTLATACTTEKQVDFAGTVVDPPFAVADIALRNTRTGAPFSFAEDLSSPLTLVFFGYSGCPDICPTVLSSLASGLTQLEPAQREQVNVFMATTDPARDTAPVLKEYLARFDPAYAGITGDIRDIAAVGKSVGVYVDEGKALDGGGYEPNAHGTYVVAIHDDGSAPAVWGRDTSPSQFAADITLLLDGPVTNADNNAGTG